MRIKENEETLEKNRLTVNITKAKNLLPENYKSSRLTLLTSANITPAGYLSEKDSHNLPRCINPSAKIFFSSLPLAVPMQRALADVYAAISCAPLIPTDDPMHVT